MKIKIDPFFLFLISILTSFALLFPYTSDCAQSGPGFEYLGSIKCNNNYSTSFLIFCLLSVGVIYSTFIVLSFCKEKSFIHNLALLIVLIFVYILTVFSSLYYFGIPIPIMGGIGAFIINKIIDKSFRKSNLKITFAGIISSLISFIAVYLFMYYDTLEIGIIYLIAILPWQFTIGLMLIPNKLTASK